MATSPPRAPGCAAKGATCIDTGSVAESLEQRQKPRRIVPVGFAPRPRRPGFAVGAPAAFLIAFVQADRLPQSRGIERALDQRQAGTHRAADGAERPQTRQTGGR